jgi:hypothetical protein
MRLRSCARLACAEVTTPRPGLRHFKLSHAALASWPDFCGSLRPSTPSDGDSITCRMKRLAVGLTVTVLLVGLGYHGLGRYKKEQFIEAVSSPIKNASLRVANAATYETNDETKITFKELFDKLELDIGEIDKRILEVQTLAAPNQKNMTDSAVEYMRGSQSVLRTLLAKYRRSLSLASASQAYEAAQEALSSSGDLSLYKLEALLKASKERKKAAEELSESVSDVLSSVKTLRGALARVATVANFRSDVLIDPAILETIAKKNEPRVAVGAKPDSTVPANGPEATALPAAAPRGASAHKAAPVHRAARVPTDEEEDERLRKQREQWVAEAEREQRNAEHDKGGRLDNDIERLRNSTVTTPAPRHPAKESKVDMKPKGNDADPFQ